MLTAAVIQLVCLVEIACDFEVYLTLVSNMSTRQLATQVS